MPRFATVRLLFNHLDAWVVSMAAAVAALIVHDSLTIHTLPLVGCIGLGYWLAFAINDYFDAPADAADGSKAAGNYFLNAGASSRWFWTVAAVLGVAVSVVLTQFGWAGVLILGLGVVVAWSYSAPPMRLKERPGVDLLIHALFVEVFPYVGVVMMIGATWTTLDLFILGVLFLGSFSAQLEQQLRDFDLDTLTGNTFTTTAGRGVAYAMLITATVLLLGGAGYFFLRGGVPLFLVPYGLIPLPALLHRLVRGSEKSRSPALVAVSAALALIYTVGLIAHELSRAPSA